MKFHRPDDDLVLNNFDKENFELLDTGTNFAKAPWIVG